MTRSNIFLIRLKTVHWHSWDVSTAVLCLIKTLKIIVHTSSSKSKDGRNNPYYRTDVQYSTVSMNNCALFITKLNQLCTILGITQWYWVTHLYNKEQHNFVFRPDYWRDYESSGEHTVFLDYRSCLAHVQSLLSYISPHTYWPYRVLGQKDSFFKKGKIQFLAYWKYAMWFIALCKM